MSLARQLDEVIERYAVDGIWIDGDNWAAYPDCSDEGLAAFAQSSGLRLTRAEVPCGPGDQHWFAFMEFWRERFREYLSGYVTELRRRHPGVEITSNHAYTAIMPEAPAIELDFLSADYYHKNSVNIARLEARVLAGQGRPWDLMPWGPQRPAAGRGGRALDQIRAAGAAGGGARDRPGRRHPVLLPAETGRLAGALAGRADGAAGPLLPAARGALLPFANGAAGGAAALHLRLLPPYRRTVHGRRSVRALVRGVDPRSWRAHRAARQPAQCRRPGGGAASATAGRVLAGGAPGVPVHRS